MRHTKREPFEEFMAVHADAMVRLSYVLCGDRTRAEDATQEAMSRVYRRWSRLDDPLVYARRCVVNATRDQWRRRGRWDRGESAIRSLGTAAPVLLDETVAERDRLVAALGRLPHRQRAVIVLRYWHQLSEAEAAATLEIPLGTVKSQTARGLARLRADLRSDLRPTTTTKEHP